MGAGTSDGTLLSGMCVGGARNKSAPVRYVEDYQALLRASTFPPRGLGLTSILSVIVCIMSKGTDGKGQQMGCSAQVPGPKTGTLKLCATAQSSTEPVPRGVQASGWAF